MCSVDVVLVTYNRKDYLLKCLDALINQSYTINRIFVIDNNSNDETYDVCHEFINRKLSNTDIIYFNTGENLGGAGGFEFGIKLALKEDICADYLWIMDDDVLPKDSCLESLMKYANDNSIVQPIRRYKDGEFVISESSNINLKNPFSSLKVNFIKNDDVLKNDALSISCFPFEGPLIPVNIINKIGYPRSDFFIMADDTEFSIRATLSGFQINMVSSALLIRQIKPVKSKQSVLDWKSYFYLRNANYIDKKYGGFFVKNIRPALRTTRYLLSSIYHKRDFISFKVVVIAYIDSFSDFFGKEDNDLCRWKR